VRAGAFRLLGSRMGLIVDVGGCGWMWTRESRSLKGCKLALPVFYVFLYFTHTLLLISNDNHKIHKIHFDVLKYIGF